MCKFSDFVNIIDYNMQFDPDEAITVCKRENNSKRDFVFVQKYLGKHVPVKINDIMLYFEDLRANIQKRADFNRNEKLCVIGFAETATAIANYLAEKLPNVSYYLQTTREKSDKPLLVQFKEEHSHATDQCLYGDLQKLKECDRILFVDDEISTGKTIENFITELNKLGNFKYGIASFLNLMPVETYQKFQNNNIPMWYSLRGTIKDINAIVNVEQLPDISNLNEIYKIDSDNRKKCILNIGTEEDMYYVMKHILTENTVLDREYFQASTRSPIAPAKSKDYSLKSRMRFPSIHDRFRRVFLYNLQPYQAIYVYARGLKKPFSLKAKDWINEVYMKLEPYSDLGVFFSDYDDLEVLLNETC